MVPRETHLRSLNFGRAGTLTANHMVPKEGVEPSWVSPHDFESCVYTNFTTSALLLRTKNLWHDFACPVVTERREVYCGESCVYTIRQSADHHRGLQIGLYYTKLSRASQYKSSPLNKEAAPRSALGGVVGCGYDSRSWCYSTSSWRTRSIRFGMGDRGSLFASSLNESRSSWLGLPRGKRMTFGTATGSICSGGFTNVSPF